MIKSTVYLGQFREYERKSFIYGVYVMQPIYIYLVTYIVPVFVIISLATYVIIRNNRALENRLIFLLLMFFCISLIGEFLRHVSPISYNPFITVYIVGLNVTISMALIIHLEFVLLKNHCNLKTHPFLPFIGYSIIPIHVILTTFVITLSASDFHQSGSWIYRENIFYNIWIYGAVGLMATVAFFVCLYGWSNSTTKHGNMLFLYLSVGTTVIFISFLIAMLVLKTERTIPNPTMFLIFLVGVLFAIGVTKFEMTPSIRARYQTMFDLTPTSIMLLNERLEILEINHRAKSFFYDSADGNLKSYLYQTANIRQGLRVIKKLREEKVLNNFQVDFFHPKTDEKITLLLEATLLPFQSDFQYYFMWQDITHEVEQEQLIHHLAYHDTLTGIQNRAYFVNNVQNILHKHSHQQHALILIDLNYFKQINDSYGHLVGDAVLQFVAQQLQALVGTSGFAARLGGDEFVLLYKNIESVAQVEAYIEAIRRHFNQTVFHYGDFLQSISLSIGYSHFPLDGTHFEVLLNIADMNMYDDKFKNKRLHERKV